MQLADGTTHQFEDPAADAEMIRTLAENNALATDRLEPGAEFIASPARGNAGICFLRVEKGPVQ
ncbi:MAG: hypothetical protein H5U13_11475 [Parvibaculum sp.]|nr:hypothetical protein [Parvibaculum sp.]